MKNFHLCDDGTLDTVIECETCGQEERFSDVERDSDGTLTDETFSSLCEQHECEGPEDCSHAALAERWHGGQWSPLYAFLSTGTVVEGLSSEILSCMSHAEKNSHPVEHSALFDFAQWAEAEEAKLFPSED